MSRKLLPLLALLAACGSSSSGSSSGGSSSDIVASFQFSESLIFENTETRTIFVELSEAPDDDFELYFFPSGSAFLNDYAMVSLSPVTVNAGDVTVPITISIFEDLLGELDETIVINLLATGPISVGAPATHTITIVDDDETLVGEAEPNDDHTTANVVGGIGPDISFTVTGDALNDGTFDVFEFNVVVDATIHVSLDPQSGIAEAVLNILDENGTVVAVLDDDQGGTTVGTSFGALAGQTFFLAVTTELVGTSYALEVVGV